MPWRTRKIPVQGHDDWAIQKKVGNRWVIVGRSSSKEKAEASIRARQASE